ncbi:DUF1583 domain-containing protein [Gimesia aquarii]|uniref:DUF1583 domain-containing protein n=1 Tax=Gimesia aquarii TaxID=2527964 RepID=A0A517VZ61_9PLAN|nr:DUF1583 domain-containing protein [Gimesia aquarii]QDT98296.1 hypothetical protein V144x_37820 [Gimesia aquarii]
MKYWLKIGSRFVLCLCLMITVFSPLVAEEYAREHFFSFWGEQFDNELLVPLGRGTVKLLQPRSEGLLFTLPTGYKLSAVGVSPRFQIQGDFEITASFEVPSWKDPESGYGMGPSLYLRMHDEKESAVMIGRLLRPEHKHVFSTTLSTTVASKRNYNVKLYDTKTNIGKLRLVRESSMLKFFVSEGASEPFRELREVELGTADVDLLRLGVQQSDIKTPVRVLWKDLSIKAEAFPNHPESQAKGERYHVPSYNPAPQPEQISIYWSLIAGIVLIILLGTVVWVKKRV